MRDKPFAGTSPYSRFRRAAKETLKRKSESEYNNQKQDKEVKNEQV